MTRHTAWGLACALTCVFACSSTASSGGSGGGDAGDEDAATVCASALPACAPAPSSQAPVGGIYGTDALPRGACSSGAACDMLIDPCPNWRGHAGGERTDGYACACKGGQWQCTRCSQGARLCAETPDGGTTVPPPDASRD